MTKSMREPTLTTLGLGGVLEIFANGKLPVRAADLVEEVFGEEGDRGSLVISGANGIVGAGKTMQLGSRLQPFGVRVVGLDLPGAPDGLGRQYQGLVRSFGREKAAEIMQGIVRMHYDGKTLPRDLAAFRPRFLLEAIPEILSVKRAHYEVFRSAFPGIEIRSVTSGFPSRELGVGIAHPAFPHEINKIWEVVEPKPSAITKMFWALGLIPTPVSDDWSFVLDVLFCGATNAALKYHHARNMPFWKIDKFVRRLVGPNPFRAHDAIGAAGANFLTWSCLHHLSERYGPLFEPAPELVEHKETGQPWYPMNHFRPLVDWPLDREGEKDLETFLLGPLFQMTSLMLHEKRAHPSLMNAIGEICAQFRPGILARLRQYGPERAIALVEAWHALDPASKKGAWHPDALGSMVSAEWQQLYVNAEHDGKVGVITIGRESYSRDVDAELNRAIDWLKSQKIENVILSGDFHLSTQLVGADTSNFYPALEDAAVGFAVARDWTSTARRLHDEFATSVGFVHGKRCLGGCLELMMHCHYLIAAEDVQFGMPEVTLPVVPGMEGCHWSFRKADQADWPKLMKMLLSGRPVRASEATGWLCDFAGPLEDALKEAWAIASGKGSRTKRRTLEAGPLSGVPEDVPRLPAPQSPAEEEARRAISECVRKSCGAPLSEALEIQARISGDFMVSKACLSGAIGTDYKKTVKI
ncbi:MAG: hypothetical protein Fur0037_18140 [Planctomycetota bacterium]